MKLNTVFEENTCTIAIESSIDTPTARELEQAVNAARTPRSPFDPAGPLFLRFSSFQSV